MRNKKFQSFLRKIKLVAYFTVIIHLQLYLISNILLASRADLNIAQINVTANFLIQ